MVQPIIIYCGGTDPERLYLKDFAFDMPDGRHVVVRKTVISDDPGNMEKLNDMIARHIGRYGQVALFCRPGYRVLDFPCGSGYAASFLKQFGIIYEGREIDEVTRVYAELVHGTANTCFVTGDLTDPVLPEAYYDVIGCIEGVEHIQQQYQSSLVEAFKRSLKPGGVLVISSPENKTGVSGPSMDNPDHLWELNRKDFVHLLQTHFLAKNIEIVTHKAVLDPGGLMTCFYGICHQTE